MKDQIPYIVSLLLALVAIPSLYLIFRRGSKIPEGIEDTDSEVKLSMDQVSDVVETTFEIIEEEHLQDEEFENKVTKIKSDFDIMSDADVAEYINDFLGVDTTENPIACTDDKSRFEWKSEAGQE